MRLKIILAALVLTGAAQAQQLTQQQLMQVRSACEGDVRRLCSAVQPGGGRLATCLQDNVANVSQPCKETLAAIKASRQGQ